MLLAGAGVSVVAAVALVIKAPVLGLALVLAPLLLSRIVASAPSRLFVVVAGGLLVFQSSDSVGPAKFAYLAAAAVCVAVSGYRLATGSSSAVVSFRPMLAGSAVLVGYLVLNAVVARLHGVAATDWARDAAPYFLLATLPIVGLDAGTDISSRVLERTIGVLGVVAAAGFAVDWLNRRGVSSLGVGRLVLATTTLAALGFSFAMVRAAGGPQRIRWAAAAVAVLALMLVTGTRTNLVLLAAVIGVVGSRAKSRVSLLRGLTVVAALALAAAAAIPALASRLSDDPQFISRRLEDLRVALSGGSDQSLAARTFDYRLARAQFDGHAWFGFGAGHLYDQPKGPPTVSLDTPWAVLAKFGIVGTALLLWYLLGTVRSMVRARRITGPLSLYVVGRGWLFVLVALAVVIPWTEDKGSALALTLLVAAVAARLREFVAGPRPETAFEVPMATPEAVLL